MIYIKCGVQMHGATVLVGDAIEAIATAQTLRGIGILVEGFASETGEAVTMFALRLMATNQPILVPEF